MSDKSGLSEHDLNEITLALHDRMTVNAFGRGGFLDARNGLILKRAGFAVDREPRERIEQELSELLIDAGHERRIPLPPGPLVCYLEKSPLNRSILQVKHLLLSEDHGGRVAAIDYFLGLEGSHPRCLTPHTRAILAECAADIRSEVGELWDRSAVRLHDALTDDFLLTLAGFLQCRSVGYREGTDEFLNDVLRPNLTTLDSLPLEILDSGKERESLSERLAEVASHSAGLAEAGDRFMDLAGHLPLDHTLGLARAIKPWIDQLSSEDAWTQVWAWAEGTRSPAARYHACLLFLETPTCVPESKWSTLRDEILGVVGPGIVDGPSADFPLHAAWRVRCDLACHYEQYLESFLPGFEAGRIAQLAWWLAERVALTFEDGQEHLRGVLARVVLATREFTAGLWEVIRPPMVASPLRFATLFSSSAWSLSMLAQLGSLHPAGTLVELFDDRGADLERALIAGTVLGFPPPQKHDEEPVYGFERTAAATVKRWVAERDDAEATAILEACLALFLGSAEPEELSRRLDRLPRTAPEEQFLIVQHLKAAAFGAPPDGAVYDRLVDPEWAKETFDGLTPQTLEIFCDALFELLLRHGGRWLASLPHILASRVLEHSLEPERRGLLLAYTILFSIASGTTGAVTRILLAEDRHLLARDLDYWRCRLEEIFGVCSPWAQSRIRPVLSHLSTGQGAPTPVLLNNDIDESGDPPEI